MALSSIPAPDHECIKICTTGPWDHSFDRQRYQYGDWLLAHAGEIPETQTAQEQKVLAIATAILEAISNEDVVASTNLMVADAMIYGAGLRDGESTSSTRSRLEERERILHRDGLERGHQPEVKVSGSVAMVWYPYDLWADQSWVHCGVNVFSMLKQDGQWRVTSITFSMDQPPLCAMHPDGPLAGPAS